jgi:hypothetical protein
VDDLGAQVNNRNQTAFMTDDRMEESDRGDTRCFLVLSVDFGSIEAWQVCDLHYNQKAATSAK